MADLPDFIVPSLDTTVDAAYNGEGSVYKAIVFGDDGTIRRDVVSKQLTEDPFVGMIGYGANLRIPPYSLEQLVALSESHPIHSSCLEQKMVDTIGDGPQVIAIDEEATEGDKKEKAAFQKWIEDITEEYTTIEVLSAEHMDYETNGFGAIEIGRDDATGEVKRIWHVPTHTLRAHRSGRLWCQIRQGRQMWFKSWGEPGEFLAANGRFATEKRDQWKDKGQLANELLVFKKPSRRSTWYGIPQYVSGIGHLALAIAARAYNISFFDNAREPRYVFVITGLGGPNGDVDKTINTLAQTLQTQHREHHRNLLLPLGGKATVQIERLTLQQNDMHFVKLMERTDEELLIAHRMPPDRLGIARKGFLGGSVANVTNRIYKDGVVARTQAVLEDRLGRFLTTEYLRAAHGKEYKPEDPNSDTAKWPWKIDFQAPDISDDQVDASVVTLLLKHEAITLNEARLKLGKAQRAEFGDLTLGQWIKQEELGGGGGAPAEGAVAASMYGYPSEDLSAVFQDIRGGQLETLRRFDNLDEWLEEAVFSDADHDLSSVNHRNGATAAAL